MGLHKCGQFDGCIVLQNYCEWMYGGLGGTTSNLLGLGLDKQMGIIAMESNKRIVFVESDKMILLVVVIVHLD